jgi:putative CocE/NonD family hydrolase
VREDGFIPFWANMTEAAGHVRYALRQEQLKRPDWDDFWASLTPDLERIQVPTLLCASFSDHGLHTRGSFEAFRRLGSKDRFVFTHRGGKWSTYYSKEALELQARFFDHYLKGEENGFTQEARVRLEVRSRGDEVHGVRNVAAWPLPSTRWESWYLAPGELRLTPLKGAAKAEVSLPQGRASFLITFSEDMELTGPMKLKLWVELAGVMDANLFAGVRKISGGKVVSFEGTAGFGRDTVTKGWLRLAHRRLDPARSEPHRPVHPCDRPEPLAPGRIEPIEIELLPSSTFFRRGDQLRLDVQGHFFWPRSLLWGTFPAAFAPSGEGRLTLHFGDEYDAQLLVPRIS